MQLSVLFTTSSPYKKWARFLATLWTLLIFILCLLPGKDIPDVQVPFIDKWVHFILFGAFAFLWLCAYPGKGWRLSIYVLALSIFTGGLIEELQGLFPTLGRTKDIMDALADSIGGLLGILLFSGCAYLTRVKK